LEGTENSRKRNTDTQAEDNLLLSKTVSYTKEECLKLCRK